MAEENADNSMAQPFLQASADNFGSTNADVKIMPTLSAPRKSPYVILNQIPDGEDFLTTFIKRVYAESNLIVMAANTMSSIVGISSLISLIPYQGTIVGNDFCEYGNSLGAFIQCPYLTSPDFQAIISLWCIYFLVYFLWRYYWTSFYETNDLRYYVYYDKFNSTAGNRVLIALGVMLTIVSGGEGVYSVAHNGTTNAVPSMLVFMAVNLYNLVQMGSCRYSVLASLDMNKTEAFRRPIPVDTEGLWTVGNLNGLLLSHIVLFEHLNQALSALYLMNDDRYIKRLGNVEQLRLVSVTLNPLQAPI